MISNEDLDTIRKHAKKYKITKIILFGSSKENENARDIDLGVKGINPEDFFKFFWEIYRDLSKPVDIIDLDNTIECTTSNRN